MSDAHLISFLGQNIGIIIKSTSKFKSHLFIQCFKKNKNGIWEKPSNKEGKTIKFSLEEMIMILRVLSRKMLNWKGFHAFEERRTSFSFSWEDEESNILWITIADYSKVLDFAQVEIFRLLLRHLIEEKVVYSTSYIKKNFKFKHNELPFEIHNIFQQKDKAVFGGEDDLLKNIGKIKAIITGETEKAILLTFSSNKHCWIPKSSVHNPYLPRKNFNQTFLIDKWILKKNEILF
jgi:hypothetical protein